LWRQFRFKLKQNPRVAVRKKLLRHLALSRPLLGPRPHGRR
jgi:hypothetical protein